MVASRQTNPRTKESRYEFSLEGLRFAFDVYFNETKLTLFRELRALVAYMNSEE